MAAPYEITQDGQFITGQGKLMTVVLKGTDATLILYDNTAKSGRKLCDIQCSAQLPTIVIPYPRGNSFGKGIHADIEGTTPVAIITVA